jgi:hypothetical protein
MNQRALVCIALSSLIACGDDGGHPHTIDAKTQVDAQSCSAITGGTLDFDGYSAPSTSSDGAIFWSGDIGETLDGNKLTYELEFYGGIEDSLAGTFQLNAGMQANYATCAICLRVFEYDNSMPPALVKQFFQSGGSINLTEDPMVSQKLNASITDLQLVEVDVSDTDFTSTPVAGGQCLNYANNTVMHDNVYNAWTCDHAKYNSGGSCTCQCGITDPDCANDAAALEGCGATDCNGGPCDTCFATACVDRPANDLCTSTSLPIVAIGATGVTGTTAGAKHDYDMGLSACTPGAEQYGLPGPDVAYKVVLQGGTAYTFTLTPTAMNVDLSLTLVGDGAAAAGTVCTANVTATYCKAGSDMGVNGEAETFTFTPPGTGALTYYLIVDAWNPYVGGAFTLTVQ